MSEGRDPSTVGEPVRYWPGRRGRRLPFVLLRHQPKDGRPVHFDLLLDLHPGKALWGLESLHDPRSPGSFVEWRTHGFHRRRYLRYEGDIGRGRGVVTRVDHGAYRVRGRKGILWIEIEGSGWRGTYRIDRLGPGRHRWIVPSPGAAHPSGALASAPERPGPTRENASEPSRDRRVRRGG